MRGDELYEFKTTVRWERDRVCTLRTGSGRTVEFSSPPEFKGVSGLVTPEELFVASENACFLMTLIFYTEKIRVRLLSYNCEAVGYLEQGERSLFFSKIVLRPKISVRSEEDLTKVKKALELAKRRCFVGNSIKSKIVVEPEISVSEEGHTDLSF